MTPGQDAADLLRHFGATALDEHQAAVSELVKVRMGQRQFDALYCFCAGVGLHKFKASSTLRKYNLGDTLEAFEAMAGWGGKAQKLRRSVERFVGTGISTKQALVLAREEANG